MGEIPKVCSFRGARELVMERVWGKVNKLEAKGIPMTHELFGQLIREEWKKVKEEARKVCPVISPEELRRVLEEIETGVPKAAQETVEGGEGRPVEAKIAVSIKAQKAEE